MGIVSAVPIIIMCTLVVTVRMVVGSGAVVVYADWVGVPVRMHEIAMSMRVAVASDGTYRGLAYRSLVGARQPHSATRREAGHGRTAKAGRRHPAARSRRMALAQGAARARRPSAAAAGCARHQRRS